MPIAALCVFRALGVPALWGCALPGPANATYGFGGREGGPPSACEACIVTAAGVAVAGLLALGVWAFLDPDGPVPAPPEP